MEERRTPIPEIRVYKCKYSAGSFCPKVKIGINNLARIVRAITLSFMFLIILCLIIVILMRSENFLLLQKKRSLDTFGLITSAHASPPARYGEHLKFAASPVRF